MGIDWQARLDERSREFGRRHSALVAAFCLLFFAGATAICCFQLKHGTYLGTGWVIGAVCGGTAAVALTAAFVIDARRRGTAASGLGLAWTVVAVLSVAGIGLAFPVEPYGGIQVLNLAKAVLLGYFTVICTLITVLVLLGVYLVARPQRPVDGGRGGKHSRP